MSAKDWTAFADGLITDFGVEFGNGENNPVTYHVKATVSGGNSPIDQPVVTTEDVPMNAVFTSVLNTLIDGIIVKKGDMSVVATYDGDINPGDTIKRDGKEYIVIPSDPVEPYGQSIVKKLIVRLK